MLYNENVWAWPCTVLEAFQISGRPDGLAGWSSGLNPLLSHFYSATLFSKSRDMHAQNRKAAFKIN